MRWTVLESRACVITLAPSVPTASHEVEGLSGISITKNQNIAKFKPYLYVLFNGIYQKNIYTIRVNTVLN